MAREYKIDFEEIATKRDGKEFSELVELLKRCVEQVEPINFDEYENDPKRFERFEATEKIIRSVCSGNKYKVTSDIGQNGLTGTISIRCKELAPHDLELFKAAVLMADSLEVEGGNNDDVVIDLSFFKMLRKK